MHRDESDCGGHDEDNTAPMSPQGDAAAESPFVKTITADAVCTVLSHVHPRDGFPVIYLCKAIRDLVGQLGEGLWEWWALALWPKTTVAPVVPQMYDTFEALVRDDNRRGAMPTVRWPDVGHDQPVSLYTCNTSSYFFACRVLAAEFNRYDRLLHVHFDVRGEGDLVPPCFAWLSLGPANSGWWVEASAMPHTLRRVKSGEAAFVAEPVLAASASSSWGHSRWPYIELGGRAWWRGNVGRGKRCSGHVTFEMERFDKKLREHAAGLLGPWAVKSEPLQLNFYYARNPDYERATLAEWPSSEPVSISEVLSTYSSGDGELGVFAAGEVSAKVTLSEEEDTVEYAKQKSFAFAPDRTKSRSEWWA